MSEQELSLQEQIKAFCQERGLDHEEVMTAIERAIAGAYRKEFGDKDKTYAAEYDVDNQKYKIFETLKVTEPTEEVELNPKREISLVDARLEDPTVELGDELKKEVAVNKEINFGRIASQVAKQVLIYTVNNFRHTKILQKYKDYIGKIVNVEVDAYKKGGYIVKIGQGNEQTTSYMNREDMLPIDHFKPGQIIKALILDISEDENNASKIRLTRSLPEFVVSIIKKEVPEVDNGVVNIVKIVREAGNRTKILVSVNEDDGDIDPVGTILGRRNVRLLNIMREISPSLQEKIDIIEYQPDHLDHMIEDALEPAEIEGIEMSKNEEGKTLAKVTCFPDEASLAVGRRGANVRLASKLLDVEIEISSIEKTEREPAILADEEE